MPKAERTKTPRPRRTADLEKEISQLKAKTRELEERLAAQQRTLLEDGLRLSQENEVLRRKLDELKKSS
jgi:hypothetical protein